MKKNKHQSTFFSSLTRPVRPSVGLSLFCASCLSVFASLPLRVRVCSFVCLLVCLHLSVVVCFPACQFCGSLFVFLTACLSIRLFVRLVSSHFWSCASLPPCLSLPFRLFCCLSVFRLPISKSSLHLFLVICSSAFLSIPSFSVFCFHVCLFVCVSVYVHLFLFVSFSLSSYSSVHLSFFPVCFHESFRVYVFFFFFFLVCVF